MSFRLRIFLLVMVVAVTAIGATTWLTLSLASREVIRTQQAADRHRAEIRDTIERYGVTNGTWAGVATVVGELSQTTGLHIQLNTIERERLADSDNLNDRAERPVQSVPMTVSPRPKISAAGLSSVDPNALAEAEAAGVNIFGLKQPHLLRLPEDIFGTAPPAKGTASPKRIPDSPLLTIMRELAQYKAALLFLRCTPDLDALASDTAPFLSPRQLTEQAGCVRTATEDVHDDEAWSEDVRSIFATCNLQVFHRLSACLNAGFEEAMELTSPVVPVEIYLGVPDAPGINSLGQPAALGVAGLVVVALIGTAWIARRIGQPVRRLTDASRQLADGRLDVRVPAAGKSELARLSASFNAMAEAVQRSEERQRRLVADVAHEMRTPLSNLRGYLEGLSDGVIEPSRELFASLHEETMLQRRILDDLQVLALAEAGDLGYTRTPTDLADLAGGSATAHRAVAKDAGIVLTVDMPPPLWVEADPDRLRQVIGNLLTNAIRYTDAGGHVLVQLREQGGEAVLTVRDTGVGITPADLSRVFDRFWRADPARQRATGGTGLGLTIAHRIVTDHDGRIEVASRPGDGTTFTIRLPLAAEAGPGGFGGGWADTGEFSVGPPR
jgi:two-component system sensor histidine kinase BaeS